MKIRFSTVGVAIAALSLIAGCSNGGATDSGPIPVPDSGDSGDCTPTDAGYCGVCNFMTSCGVYPPGPYGMQDGLVLPPCFTGSGFWNPLGIWLDDGGNPTPVDNVPFFQDLYCSGQQQGQHWALLQIGTTDDRTSAMQGYAFCSETDGPNGYWLQSGGQVLQIIEQAHDGFPPGAGDATYAVQSNGTTYSEGVDNGQVLAPPLIDASGGWPVTYIVDLKTMVIVSSRSYGADVAQIELDFAGALDAGAE